MKQDFRVVDLAKNLSNRTAQNVKHLAIDVPYHDRLEALSKVLTCYGGTERIIVFTSTKADANQVITSNQIVQAAEVLHGDIAQNQREITMRRFKENKF